MLAEILTDSLLVPCRLSYREIDLRLSELEMSRLVRKLMSKPKSR